MANNARVIFVDIEATCFAGPDPDGVKEILSIGAVKARGGKIEKRFSAIVKPNYCEVSDFCTKLTGVTKKMAMKGRPLKAVFAHMETELQTRRYPWMSWSNFDHRIAVFESARNGVQYPFSDTYIDLQSLYAIFRGRREGGGVIEACENFGLDVSKLVKHNPLHDAIAAWMVFNELRKRMAD